MAGEPEITVIGNLAGDPELRWTQGGHAVANFTIAQTPRTFDRQSNQWMDDETLWVRCSVWREYAENVAESLRKGMRVIASGRLKARSFEDKQGNQRTNWELQVDEVAPSLRWATAQVTKTSKQSGGFGGYTSAQQPQQSPAQQDPWGTPQQQPPQYAQQQQQGQPPQQGQQPPQGGQGSQFNNMVDQYQGGQPPQQQGQPQQPSRRIQSSDYSTRTPSPAAQEPSRSSRNSISRSSSSINYPPRSAHSTANKSPSSPAYQSRSQSSQSYRDSRTRSSNSKQHHNHERTEPYSHV